MTMQRVFYSVLKSQSTNSSLPIRHRRLKSTTRCEERTVYLAMLKHHPPQQQWREVCTSRKRKLSRVRTNEIKEAPQLIKPAQLNNCCLIKIRYHSRLQKTWCPKIAKRSISLQSLGLHLTDAFFEVSHSDTVSELSSSSSKCAFITANCEFSNAGYDISEVGVRSVSPYRDPDIMVSASMETRKQTDAARSTATYTYG